MVRVTPDAFKKRFGENALLEDADTAYFFADEAGLRVSKEGFLDTFGDWETLGPDLRNIDDYDFLSGLSGEFERPVPQVNVTPMWQVEQERERLLKKGKRYGLAYFVLRPVEILLDASLVFACIALVLMQDENIFRWVQNFIFNR